MKMDKVTKLFIGIVSACLICRSIFSDDMFLFTGMFYVLCMIWIELRYSHKYTNTKGKDE